MDHGLFVRDPIKNGVLLRKTRVFNSFLHKPVNELKERTTYRVVGLQLEEEIHQCCYGVDRQQISPLKMKKIQLINLYLEKSV